MKLVTLVTLIAINLFMLSDFYAQEIPPSGELVIFIDGINFEYYDFKMELISPVCYDAHPIYHNQHYISDEYDLAVVTTNHVAQFYLTGL